MRDHFTPGIYHTILYQFITYGSLNFLNWLHTLLRWIAQKISTLSGFDVSYVLIDCSFGSHAPEVVAFVPLDSRLL